MHLYIRTHKYIYTYIYMCVCVCVCASVYLCVWSLCMHVYVY